MFLTAMGNRRSRGTRAAALSTLLVMVSGSLRLGWAAGPEREPVAKDREPWRASQRVRPVAIEDLDGKVGPDTLWRLFDGDAGAGLASAARMRLTFAEPVMIADVAGFGGSGGTFSLRSDGGGGGEIGRVDLAPAAGRWARIMAPAAPPVRSIVVQWAPTQAGAILPELEVWGRANGPAPAERGGSLSDEIFRGIPEGAESFSAKEPTRAISAATPADGRAFSVALPFDPRAVERAFLVYELDNLPHFTAARRSINGGPIVGGFGASAGAKGGLQIEEISPALLREGGNVFRFEPIRAEDPVGYRVSGLHLVVTHSTSGRAMEEAGSDDLKVARESGGFEAANGEVRHFRFGAASQPRELAINLPHAQTGRLIIAAGRASNRRRLEIDLATLKPGGNQIALGALPAVEEITLGFEGTNKKDSKLVLSELVVSGSPLPAATDPALRVTYPLHGECVNHQVHVRGTVSGPVDLYAAGGPVKNALFESGSFSFTASEKELGGGGGKPFSFALEASRKGGQRSAATIRIEGCTDLPPVVAGWDGKPVQPKDDVGAPYGVVVRAKSPTTLAFGGVELNVPAGAVDKDVRVTIRPLSPGQVPTLEAGMTNVTQGGRAFRLGPRGMVFKKPVTLSLPVDRTRVAEADGVRPFYFDEPAKQWREVPVVSPVRERVVAQISHFTDFIAATLALPEHPGLQSLDPTSLKQIKVADPGAGVQLMAPPAPNSQGTANLSYPIEVPPGRLGMEPHLAITYDSGRNNGWLGVGWDLSISSIEIDTRFGVPKYDGTERYLLDGEALTPASSPPSGAPAGTYYVRRNEGRFDWIQRVGSGTDYYWVVTDKAGVKYTYGQGAGAVLAPMNGATPNRSRIFKWLLEKAEDIHLNQVVYSYFRQTGTLAVVEGSTGEPYVQVYPSSISYTRNNGSTSVAPYSVVFNRQSSARADAFSSGRSGFLVLTDRLLESVDVKNGSSTVRRYKLNYSPGGGDFGKSLLQNIQVFGKGPTSTAIAQHDLTYFQTPRDANNYPKIFGSPTEPRSNAPYSKILASDGSGLTNSGIVEDSTVSSSWGVGGGVAGFGLESGTTEVNIEGGQRLQDANGDGLADWWPSYQHGANIQTLQTSGSRLLGPMSLQTLTGWTSPYTNELNRYMRSSFALGPIAGGEDYGNTSVANSLWEDLDGDGRVDYAASDLGTSVQVSFSRVGSPITMAGFERTGIGFECGDVLGSNLAAAPGDETAFPSGDVVTKWVAPYDGTVRVTGALKRQEPGGDGMIASLYLANTTLTKLWERFVAPDDMGDCIPLDTRPAIGGACDLNGNGFQLLNVKKGDRIYTRVGAIKSAEHDILLWDTTVKYTSTPASEAATKEAWGTSRYEWSEKNDQRTVGQFYKPWKAKYPGNVHIELTLDKDATADDVVVQVDHYHVAWGAGVTLRSFPYAAATIVAPETDPLEMDAISVEPGDEIHVTVLSDTPIDPNTIRVLSSMTYTWAGRVDPNSGNVYWGVPDCDVPMNPSDASPGAAKGCTLEPSPGPGSSSDPMWRYPIPEATISQIGPIYFPLQRWVYQRPDNVTPPSPPTLDGRRKSTTPTNNPTLNVCYETADPSAVGQQATFLIQGVDKLFLKTRTTLTTTGELGNCFSVPGSQVQLPANQQLFFSVYLPQPLRGFVNFRAGIRPTAGGSLLASPPVDLYYPDPTLPQLNRFPFVGGAEKMAAGTTTSTSASGMGTVISTRPSSPVPRTTPISPCTRGPSRRPPPGKGWRPSASVDSSSRPGASSAAPPSGSGTRRPTSSSS